MQVIGVNTVSHSSYAESTKKANSASSAGISSTPKTTTEVVTLSQAAKSGEHAISGVVESLAEDNQVYPVEMYAIPSWYGEYLFEAPMDLGGKGDWASVKYPQAAAMTESERDEYFGFITGHYQAVLADAHIDSLPEHYNALIVNRSSSEALRQQMSERVRNDPRLVELMTKMGIDKPLS